MRSIYSHFKKSIFFFVLLFSNLAHAGDINCQGTVRFVMDYPGKCQGNTAFMITASNGKWICPPTEKGNALVLAALASGKEVQAYVNDNGGSVTCATLPNYITATYLVIKE